MQSPPNFLCRECQTKADQDAALAIRFAVFVDEQRVPAELEADEYDESAVHLLAVNEATGEAIGTARLVDKGEGVVKIGRVAVLKPWRGQGVGAFLMRYALSHARADNHTRIILDAQVPVIPFYEALGFVAEGPVFDDAGIPHQHMTLALSPLPSSP